MQSQGFLQSKEWMEFQKSLGREVFEYDKEGISAKIIKHELPFGKSYLYIPRGPEMDFNQMTGGFKNPVANFVKWFKEEARKRKSIFVKFEPVFDSVAQALMESGRGFKKSRKGIQPSRTVIIDLEKDEGGLLSEMRPKTRYNINVADRHGIVVGDDDDMVSFSKLLKKTAKRDRFSPHPADYYEKLFDFANLETKLFFAKYQNKPIAAALVLIYGDSGYYLHGASDYERRSLMAPYMLHWQIIKFLKNKGISNYDLWGIDANKWPGVTRFKLGWGGRVVEYPGSFDMPISKFWYFVYRLYRWLRG